MQRLERFAHRVFSRRNPEVAHREVWVKSHQAEDPSEDLEFLFAPGKIEELVRETRTPLKIGVIGQGQAEMQPYYQVPPRGYNPKDIEHIYMAAGGAYSFVKKNGSQSLGSTYTLTEEQAQELESRVAAEKARLAQQTSG